MCSRCCGAVLVFAAASAASPLSFHDLARANQINPRANFAGTTFGEMALTLNKHLEHVDGISTRACDEFTNEALHELMELLIVSKDRQLQELYSGKGDRRALPFQTMKELQLYWQRESEVLHEHPDLSTIVRDGKCHLSVMMFVHHLSETARQQVVQLTTLPLLPPHKHFDSATVENPVEEKLFSDTAASQPHRRLRSKEPARMPRHQALKLVKTNYLKATGCQSGHIIGHGDSTFSPSCLGTDECPKWPAQFSAPFGLHATLPPIKNASSMFFYKVQDGVQKQMVDYQTYCFPFVNLLHYHTPCKLFFQSEGIFLSQPGRVNCCQFNSGNVSAVPIQFLHAFTFKGTNVSAPDYYGNSVSCDYWEGPLGFKYWTVGHHDKLYRNWGHDIVFQDGPTGVTWRWGNFDVAPQPDSIFELPGTMEECSKSCPTF